MTVDEFKNKLIKYAPFLLMDYVKSKIQVIFVDNDGCIYITDRVMNSKKGLLFYLKYFNADRSDKPVEMKPDIRDHLKYCTESRRNKLNLLIYDTSYNSIGKADLADQDPFEAYGSLCFKIIKGV